MILDGISSDFSRFSSFFGSFSCDSDFDDFLMSSDFSFSFSFSEKGREIEENSWDVDFKERKDEEKLDDEQKFGDKDEDWKKLLDCVAKIPP